MTESKGGGRLLSRGIFGARSVALCAAAALTTLTACSTPSTYAGIDLTAGGADLQLQALASRARAGNKHAQLELGIRYEEGEGVPVDLERARALYRGAASDTGGTIWVYSPPVGNAPGRVIPLDGGPKEFGLREAQWRLKRLKEARWGERKALGARQGHFNHVENRRSD